MPKNSKTQKTAPAKKAKSAPTAAPQEQEPELGAATGITVNGKFVKAPKAAKAAPAAPKAATPKAKAAKVATPKDDAPPAPTAPATRDGGKKAQVIGMLSRPEGASLGHIMTETGWQAHTVRGFVAGALKKAGIAVESFKSDAGDRTYRIAG